MKISPLDIILDGSLLKDKIFYFISGNEITLMEKIKIIILNKTKNNKSLKVININNINQYEGVGDLFDEKTIYVVNDLSKVDSKMIDEVSVSGDTFLFFFQNSPKNNKVKNIFLKRQDSYVFDCYELSKEDKRRLATSWLNKKNIAYKDDVFWFLIEKLDNKYVFFEQELEKLSYLNKKNISLDNVRKIFSTNSSGIEKIFFELFKNNQNLVNIYSEKVANQTDANSLFYIFRQFSLLIINHEDEFEFTNNIPRYLFREKKYLVEMFRKYDPNKKRRLVDLLHITEKNIRVNSGMSLLIGLRFILNFKRIITS